MTPSHSWNDSRSKLWTLDLEGHTGSCFIFIIIESETHTAQPQNHGLTTGFCVRICQADRWHFWSWTPLPLCDSHPEPIKSCSVYSMVWLRFVMKIGPGVPFRDTENSQTETGMELAEWTIKINSNGSLCVWVAPWHKFLNKKDRTNISGPVSKMRNGLIKLPLGQKPVCEISPYNHFLLKINKNLPCMAKGLIWVHVRKITTAVLYTWRILLGTFEIPFTINTRGIWE